MLPAMRTPPLLLLVLLLGVAACKSPAKEPASSSGKAAGTSGAETPESPDDPAPVPVSDLAQELLEHVVDEDIDGAMKLMISRQDFGRPEIWDALAANELARKMPADISYANTRGDSLEVVEDAVARFAGKGLEYLRTQMPEPEVKNERFDLYRGPLLVVRNADGEEQEIRLIGSLLHDKDEELWYLVHFDNKPPKPPRPSARTAPAPSPDPAPDPG